VHSDDESLVMRARRRRGALALAGTLVLAVLLVVAGWWFAAGPGAFITTPDVVGRTLVQAQSALAAEGLNGREAQTFDDTVPVGQVISSDPGAGDRVRKGGTVTLRVSQGPRVIALPDLAGKTADEATAALQGLGLELGGLSQAFDAKVPEGSVISSDPAAKAEVARGSTVSLVVSKGPQPIGVPTVTGLPRDQAEAAVTGLGLKFAAEDAFDDTVPEGVVISQDPASGTLVAGQTVKVVVSKGPQFVTVPDVQGKQIGDARTELEGLGLQVQVDKVLGAFFGTVRDQEPKAGEQVPRGTVVTLKVV
jgi:serine/threonine-protein kinase